MCHSFETLHRMVKTNFGSVVGNPIAFYLDGYFQYEMDHALQFPKFDYASFYRSQIG